MKKSTELTRKDNINPKNKQGTKTEEVEERRLNLTKYMVIRKRL